MSKVYLLLGGVAAPCGNGIDSLFVATGSRCEAPPDAGRFLTDALGAAAPGNIATVGESLLQLAAEEDVKRIRPDLDGTQIMSLLDLQPGPLVGEATRHMLALRLDRGPLDPDQAMAELLAWARDRGVSVPAAPSGVLPVAAGGSTER